MASRGTALTLTYTAWDTVNNQPMIDDSANHTIRWIKDGVLTVPTNVGSITQVSNTVAKGEYNITMTIGECTCDFGKLVGVSSTSGVVIIPVPVTFEKGDWLTTGDYTVPPTAVAISGQVASDLLSAHGAGSWATATSVTVSDKTGFSLVSTGLDLVLVAGKTLPNAIKYIGAGVAGVVSGAGTGTEVFKDFAGSTVFTVTVDTDGNRSSVVYV